MVSQIDLQARKRAAKVFFEKFKGVIDKILRGEDPVMEILARTRANVIFDEERKLLLPGSKTLTRKFLDKGEAKRFTNTLLMASLIYDALLNDEYPTIRDLYYKGKHTIVYRDLKGRKREENTWNEQKESDRLIVDVEVFTGMLREEMLILSKEKGKVVGNMRIRSGDDVIDLSKMGHGAYAIEPTPDLIEFIDVDAEYVLVIEKDAVFQQLHRIKFWQKNKCILITSSGQPDRATRRFVRRLNEELGLPVYILTDADPYGWYIFSVFRSGSISLSFENERLATPNAKFLGVSMSDIFEKNWLSPRERKNVIIKAKEEDIKRAKEMMRYEWFKNSKKWMHELKLFLKEKKKLEIEALAVKGLKFLSEVYIPQKIQTKDWIE